jgi:hypothetical protein
MAEVDESPPIMPNGLEAARAEAANINAITIIPNRFIIGNLPDHV